MNKINKLKKYSELFNRGIEQFLSKNISIRTTVYPADGPGAIFEFIFNPEGDKSFSMKTPQPSVGKILSTIPQQLISEVFDEIEFGGTNIYMEGNRLLLIKGEDAPEEWNGNAVLNDVMRVVSTSQASK